MARRRIRRPKAQEETYKALTDKEEFGVFASYKDVFMLSGVLGFYHEKKEAFQESMEGIAWSVFNLETDEAVINAVALGDTGDVQMLDGDDDTFDKKVIIFEEYAAGGLPILYDQIMENKQYALQNYFDLIMSMKKEKPENERNIDDILGSLSF